MSVVSKKDIEIKASEPNEKLLKEAITRLNENVLEGASQELLAKKSELVSEKVLAGNFSNEVQTFDTKESQECLLKENFWEKDITGDLCNIEEPFDELEVIFGSVKKEPENLILKTNSELFLWPPKKAKK